MALYNGNIPKNDDERVRRNPVNFNTIPVSWDGVKRLPDLPKHTEWCQATLDWWKAWQESAQSMVMTKTDFQVMLETAHIHNKAFKDPDRLAPTYFTNLLAELRRRVSAYGATWEDRRKLKMAIESPAEMAFQEQQIKAEVDATVDYLNLVNKAVAEE